MSSSIATLRHISIRVAWHDAKWNGSVCKSPAHNTSCLKLKNIFENKDEHQEVPTTPRRLDSVAAIESGE